MMRSNQSPRAGLGALQLLEALGVLVVAAFCFYSYANAHAEAAKRTLTLHRVAAIQEALEKYCIDCGGQCPTAKQGLAALLAKPTREPIPSQWAGPYLKDPAMLRDGWNRPLKYVCPGRPLAPGSSIMAPYDLASYGRDGAEGGTGLDRDITTGNRSTMAP